MCAFMCRLTAIVHGWHTDAGERTKKNIENRIQHKRDRCEIEQKY